MLPQPDNQTVEANNQESKLQDDIQQQGKRDKAGIDAWILALLPFVGIILFYVAPDNSFMKNGPGIKSFFFFIFYLPLILPMSLTCSAVYALRGLKGKNRILAALALIMAAITLILTMKFVTTK